MSLAGALLTGGFCQTWGFSTTKTGKGTSCARAINGKEMNSALAPESAAQSLDFFVGRPWLTANEMLAFYI
jgi:hypothetical protein